MLAKSIIEPGSIDLENSIFGPEEIRARNSQRFELEMLDRVVHFDPENATIAGVHVVREDAFWARGHFPDRPILPGILMIEIAGQLCSFFFGEIYDSNEVLGFAACEAVRFRGVVHPGSEFLMVGEMVVLRSKLAKFSAQGYVDGKRVFDGTIVGMKI